MFKKFSLSLVCVIGLTILITACQSPPGLNLFNSDSQQTDQAAPLSNFVDRRQSLYARVGEPLTIASYHRGYDKLATLEILVNGQPLRSETTAGQPNVFPENLATTEILIRGEPAHADLQQAAFPSSACQYLLANAGPARLSSVPLDSPSSVWTVCHIWIAQTPGTYNLSLVAVDEAGREGEPITQRIEVR